MELYRIVIPLNSINPLWHEVTIGENVIGNWKYGGRDEEGYLRFYDQNQTIVLPPSAHTFDASGQFVVIEEFNSSSLTYATPFAAIPLKWLLAGATILAALIWLITGSFHRSKAFKSKQAVKSQPGFRQRIQPPAKKRPSRKRFRPSGRSRYH